MKRVTGLGGVFFKTPDRERTLNWYRTHLGIDSAEWGGLPFQWRDLDQPDEIGYTVWSAFPEDTKHFGPGQQPFMLNYRVDDLAALVAALREEGVKVLGDVEEHPNGKFAWIVDSDGRRVELWEPVPSSDDPYL